MLKSCNFKLYSISITGKLLDFTEFVISMSLNWGLNASKASAKVAMTHSAQKQLMNVRRGSQFVLYWGWSKSSFNKVTLYWSGTNWEIGAGVQIDLVHMSWELSRIPVKGVFTDATQANIAEKIAKEKGINLKTNLGKEPKVVAVSQNAEDEFLRQFKGQIIKHGFDGKTLEVVSFETIKDSAQVYYISSELGAIGSLVISYRATVPKDKSYIEMLGGGGQADSPIAAVTTTTGSNVKLQPGNYALLIPTGKKNNRQNPILELKIVLDGKQFASFPAVNGVASSQNKNRATAGILAPLQDGEYTIGTSVIINRVVYELGGSLIAITPNFKTARSDLAIHLDPSYNTSGRDGTAGCIGITTVADRDALFKILIEKKVRRLVVNLLGPQNRIEEESNKIASSNSSYFIGKLASQKAIASNNPQVIFKTNLTSLYVGLAILKSGLLLSKVPPGSTQTIRQLLTAMYSQSQALALSVLIDELGGISALNDFISSQGFSKTSVGVNSILETTAKDLFECFKSIFITRGAKAKFIQSSLIGTNNQLGFTRQTHSLVGESSKFYGGVSYVLGRSSINYIVVIFANSAKEAKEISSSINPLLE